MEQLNIQETGSARSQIILLTNRIKHLTEHLKRNKKDHSTKKGLLNMVGMRSRLLKYLHRKELETYRKVREELSL